MELEFWAVVSQAISQVSMTFRHHQRDVHPTSWIVRVHLWSVLHDRPTFWACRRENWTAQTRPPQMPDQSTMSRRMRRSDFDAFMDRLGQRLNGTVTPSLLKIVDGKPLELPNHTGDRDAKWGRGVSRMSIGYKLHVIYSAAGVMPDAFVITALNVCEKRMAARMIRRVKGGGYLAADGHYDAAWLFDLCRHHGHQLLCPRAKPGTGLGHHYQSPWRIRAIEMLEPPAAINGFGSQLYKGRTAVERSFSNATCFGGGLTTLPSWVRRIWRVRRWVHGKLLINAIRIKLLGRKTG